MLYVISCILNEVVGGDTYLVTLRTNCGKYELTTELWCKLVSELLVIDLLVKLNDVVTST